MVDVTIKIQHIRQLEQVFGKMPKELRKQARYAINDVAKQHKTALTKTTTSPIAKRVSISSKGLKKSISVRTANGDKLQAGIKIKKSRRISLKEYGGRQTAEGVKYRIEKGGERELVKGAFKVEELGGHFFKRKHPYIHTTYSRVKGKGKRRKYYKTDQQTVLGARGNKGLRRRNRMLTQKLRGPSVWGVYEWNELKSGYSIPNIRASLPKAIKKRLKAGLYGRKK